MPPADQALIGSMIPQHAGQLQGDYVQQIEQLWSQLSNIPNVPSLDKFLVRSEAGRVIKNILRARQTLADQTISRQNGLPELLYEQQGDGLPRVLPPADKPLNLLTVGRTYAQAYLRDSPSSKVTSCRNVFLNFGFPVSSNRHLSVPRSATE